MLNPFRCRRQLVLGALFIAATPLISACVPAGPTTTEKEAALAAEPAPTKEVIPVNGAGSDWPMLGGSFQRNLANTVDKGILDSFGVIKGKEKNVKWKAVLGSYAYGGPVIAGGRIFVGTNNAKPRDPKIEGDKGVVMCFRETDGEFLWQIVHDKLENSAIDAEYCGIASTPAVDGDRLYYVSNRGELVCADVEGDPNNPGKGKILWSLDMIKDLKVYPGGIEGGLANGSPLVLDDLVYIVTSNGVNMQDQKPASPEAPSFLAVDKKTGKPVWQSNLPGKNILDGQWGNAVAAEVNGKKQVIFPGGDGWLYAFEAKAGDLLWKFDCNPKDSSFKKGSRNYLIATPVVQDGKLYVGVGREPDQGTGVGHLWCVDITKEPKNKDKDLSPANDTFDPKDPANKDSGLVWHLGGKVADPVRDYAFGRTMSSVVVHDGLAYAVDLDGFFYCFDAKTGEKLWTHDMSGGTWASPYYVDGKVYIGIDGGDLFIFEAGRTKKDPITIKTGADLKVPLVAAHGVLYLNRADFLFAIAAK
jgi:outer membrane protein assembly factor BamB